MDIKFPNRLAAGQLLARQLAPFANDPSVVVLALPRGGVPVGYEIARELSAPLDVFIVRKLGVPAQEELAMGAIASGGIRVLNPDVIRKLRITNETIDAVAATEGRELSRREHAYRRGRDPLSVTGRLVILVDDGLATGASMSAAVHALRRKHPARIVVAVPVGAIETCDRLQREADEVVCGIPAKQFNALGHWYHDFAQTTDEEVCDLLDRKLLCAGAGPKRFDKVIPVADNGLGE